MRRVSNHEQIVVASSFETRFKRSAPQDEEKGYLMTWLEPVSLRGPHARLEPLSQHHCDGLIEAVNDGELWKLWYTFVPRAEDMKKEIDRRLSLQAAGSMLPFTVLDADGKIAGMINHQSRRGIERLGAKQDGILRNHQIAPNGTLRDTVVYSIIASEWPTVKAHLNYQLNEKAR